MADVYSQLKMSLNCLSNNRCDHIAQNDNNNNQSICSMTLINMIINGKNNEISARYHLNEKIIMHSNESYLVTNRNIEKNSNENPFQFNQLIDDESEHCKHDTNTRTDTSKVASSIADNRATNFNEKVSRSI